MSRPRHMSAADECVATTVVLENRIRTEWRLVHVWRRQLAAPIPQLRVLADEHVRAFQRNRAAHHEMLLRLYLGIRAEARRDLNTPVEEALRW